MVCRYVVDRDRRGVCGRRGGFVRTAWVFWFGGRTFGWDVFFFTWTWIWSKFYSFFGGRGYCVIRVFRFVFFFAGLREVFFVGRVVLLSGVRRGFGYVEYVVLFIFDFCVSFR